MSPLNIAIYAIIIAIVAGLLGFTGIAGISSTIAYWCVVIFVVVFLVSLFTHYNGRRTL